jgi:chromate reductase
MRVLAISGSLRAASLNSMLLRALVRIAPPTIQVDLYRDIGQLPLFNPDLEVIDPGSVAALRSRINAADAVIIASPEYAHGVTAVIKNALDWMVGNESFVNKPVALFNTSPRASHAQKALRETLQTMSVGMVDAACIAVPLLGSGLTEGEVVEHPKIRGALLEAIDALEAAVLSRDQPGTPDARTTDTDWVDKDIEPGIVEALGQRLAASRLWSVLMRVARERAARRTASDLTQQWERDRFVSPGPVDACVQADVDRMLFAAARNFEAVELSPLAPLGTCSVVAPGSQDRIVATIRGTEVVSDPTNALALESARRLRADPSLTVKFATSHRCVRAQSFAAGPGIAAHFRLFCLSSAGHEVKDHGFVVNSLIEHIQFHLGVLAEFGKRLGTPPKVILTLRTAASRAHLGALIGCAFPGMEIEREPLTNNYYDGLRFSIDVRDVAGERINLCDGGAFDWLGKLNSNRKLAFVASAIGSQRSAVIFGLARSQSTP